MDLETCALRHAAGRGPGLDDIRAALTAHPDPISGASGHVTTRAALQVEEANLARVREGLLPAAAPILTRPFDPGPGSTLGPDQLRLAHHVLESRARILGVEGKAGTGKTFTLAAVREAAERAGWTVRGFAVSTGAVAQLREVGIEAATLKSLATRPSTETLPRQLWIVDEASLLGNGDAAVALESAHRAPVPAWSWSATAASTTRSRPMLPGAPSRPPVSVPLNSTSSVASRRPAFRRRAARRGRPRWRCHSPP